MDAQAYFLSLAIILGVGSIAWLVSVVIRNVAFVDSLWSLFFLIAALTFANAAESLSARGILVTALVAIWAIRLSVYITARNWGEPEDYRYQAIRAKNEPGFAFKSLYIVFGLQGVLAWIVALPLLPAILTPGDIGPIEIVAAVLWLTGFTFEAGGDVPSEVQIFDASEVAAGPVARVEVPQRIPLGFHSTWAPDGDRP